MRTATLLPGTAATGSSLGIGDAVRTDVRDIGAVHRMTCQTTDALALKPNPSNGEDTISPNCTRTDMTRHALAEDEEKIASCIPTAEPGEIAGLAALLAREEAAYIAGETTDANGGIYRQLPIPTEGHKNDHSHLPRRGGCAGLPPHLD
jgi:hypothetical protein